MEKIAQRALLFDFYGPLLTEKQSKVWDLYYQQDYSLSEIAEEEGISRQAVHDLLRRTENILEDYERKLKLIDRFLNEREKLLKLKSLLGTMKKEDFSSESAWKRQQNINSQIQEIISGALEEA